MAKTNAPLLSFGARGKLADALVFFPWKGINAVRKYVIPANPKSADQTTQRGYLKDAVTLIHTTQAIAGVWSAIDALAYAIWGSIFPTPRTWFNQAVKNFVDQKVAGKTGHFYCNNVTAEGDTTLDVQTRFYPGTITTGDFWYGKLKTALISSKGAGIAGGLATATITGLTNGTKYYWQFRPTAPAGSVGAYSGILSGTPHA